MTLILVTTGHPQAVEHAGPGFGRLLVPDHFARAGDTARAGIPWAADNGCFQRLDVRAFGRMLDAITGLPGCLFVAVPDVVGDAAATLRRWQVWSPIVRQTGQPLALVAQDGLRACDVPWDEVGALFVGGTTEWKVGDAAARLVYAAKRRGLHVHMGRVNGRRRFKYAEALGCDSVDGSSFSKWRNTWLPDALCWHRQPLQTRIPIEEAL